MNDDQRPSAFWPVFVGVVAGLSTLLGFFLAEALK